MNTKYLLFLFLLSSCRCDGEELAPPPPTDAGVLMVVEKLSAVTEPPTEHLAAPEPLFELVEDLRVVAGHWGAGGGEDAKGQWAELMSREEAHKVGLEWGIPYPWRLILKVGYGDQNPINCGFFEQLQENWRVGYCHGGSIKVLQAERVVLHVKDGATRQLKVGVGSRAEIVLER